MATARCLRVVHCTARQLTVTWTSSHPPLSHLSSSGCIVPLSQSCTVSSEGIPDRRRNFAGSLSSVSCPYEESPSTLEQHNTEPHRCSLKDGRQVKCNSFATQASKTRCQDETAEAQPVPPPQTFDTSLSEWQLPAEALRQISVFVDLLLEWNQRMNLTAVTERSAVMERHIGDSLALLPVIERALSETGELRGDQSKSDSPPNLEETATSSSSESSLELSTERDLTPHVQRKPLRRRKKQGGEKAEVEVEGEVESSAGGGVKRLRVVDVGTGAGLPGLVFAIARPEWDLVLVESLRKRCLFLEHVVKEAGLSNVTVVWGRAEDTVRLPNIRASADVAVARAVADLRVLAELCIPYVRKGGLFVAPKGPTPEEEVAAAEGAINVLGARIMVTERVASNGPGGQRTAVVCLKERATPAKYPRRAGVPSKSPL